LFTGVKVDLPESAETIAAMVVDRTRKMDEELSDE
jgi:hypothetical protein